MLTPDDFDSMAAASRQIGINCLTQFANAHGLPQQEMLLTHAHEYLRLAMDLTIAARTMRAGGAAPSTAPTNTPSP